MGRRGMRPRGRFGSVVAAVAVAVMTVALPGLPGQASPRPAAAGAGAEPGVLGTDLGGTGVLPNFAQSGSNLIRLLAGAFDPLAGPLPTSNGLALVNEATLAPGTPQPWLVQVKDRRFPEVQQAVATAGGQVVGYVADDTYIVRATPAQRAVIAAAAAVRWTGYLQPAWRMPAAVAGFDGILDLAPDPKRSYRVNLFRAWPDPAAVGDAIEAIPGVTRAGEYLRVVDVRLSNPAVQVPLLAAVPGVEWVSVEPDHTLLNANARWVTDTGVRDLYSAVAPGRLTGAGQTAAVLDTGVNYTYDRNGRAHLAFRDCNPDGTGCKEAMYTQASAGVDPGQLTDVVAHGTGHRKMVAYFDFGKTGPNPYDTSSHGSHTAGSVNGDTAPFDQWNGEDGMAPAANHVHQNSGTSSGGLDIPDDLYEVFSQAYRPRDPGDVPESSPETGNPADYTTDYLPLEDARTHNNSWGSGIAGVIPPPDAGIPVDQFVWDHEDMVIVFSAGNAGPDAGSLGSPALAKNDITSGASANGRQPMASIDSMASFSSHGPSADGRFGVDLATPGQIVVSVKGGTVGDYHVAQGTSMSAPVLTGLATLVRQYFFDGYAAVGGDGFAAGSPAMARRHNPSAALVKAAMVNGAVRMRGFYTGDEGTERNLDGQWPSAGQGFGQVNLSNSLYFTNDPTSNWYIDVYRGDTSGPANLQSFPVAGVAATRTFQLQVSSGAPLDVTLAWTDAPNSPVGGTSSLVNDLNLTVTGPGGTYVGNNMNTRTSPGAAVGETMSAPGPFDSRNTVERVHIENPAAGTYTVTVTAPAVALGRQGFALAAAGRIAATGGPAFVPGPALQVDEAGSPSISDVRVETVSADTAKITFATNEPTEAKAVVTIGATPTTFLDSYAVSGFPGLNEGTVESSAAYKDKPVVGERHEILLTGLSPGQTYAVDLQVKDLANNNGTAPATVATPSNVFQPNASDTGQLNEAAAGGWTTGTQMYASDTGGTDGLLGAFMFRIPESAVDPSTINGAIVELTSTHNWVNPYTSDPELFVDLLPSSLEASWGTQNYATIHDAAAAARLYPETTYKVGAYQKYAFTLSCGALQALKDTLAGSGERRAAFRYDATVEPVAGLFAMDFGFNRRSRGPDIRPKLILLTADDETAPTGIPCDPATPAPTISEVGVHPGAAANSFVVSWRTDVPSDSLVFFREQGATAWTQVGSRALTQVHAVQVTGLDPAKEHEFLIRSAACNGNATTDTNGGAGYDFDRPPYSLGTPTTIASYDFEADAQGWTVTEDSAASSEQWVREGPGHSGSFAWDLKPYGDNVDTSVVSPAGGFTVPGPTLGVRFFRSQDTEQDWDFLSVEYSADDGATWTEIDSWSGSSPGYPSFSQTEVHAADPGGNLRVRFRQTSDTNTSSPAWGGVAVDTVTLLSYPNPVDDGLPDAGPVPPPSAGGSGLTAPAVRFGPASAADIAAGTAWCEIVAPNAPPTADATATPMSAKQGQAITYSGAGSTDDRDAANELTYEWDFTSDGTVDATGVSVQKSFATPGSYTATLEVTDTDGASDTDTVTVTVTNDAKCPGYETQPGNHVIGTTASETLTGTSGVDVICGLAGDDVIDGLGGNDILIGGTGDDTLNGGLGNDVLTAGDGVDTLNGGDGDDDLTGGASPDTVNGNAGSDIARGGEGNDTMSGGDGNDKLYGERGSDVLHGGLGNDVVHTKDRVKGNDSGDAGAGTDTCKKDINDVIVNCEA